jgi:hypothetical protein
MKVDQWAEGAYDAIRASSADVSRIASNTGLSTEAIAKIKNHVFFVQHEMYDYGGQSVMKRFDPDPDIAEAWNRLASGLGTAVDHVLLDHELAEVSYMEQHAGASYEQAHSYADTVANWSKALKGDK